ncbi:hypothetical protein MAR_004188, partial [Mya arenaria]
MKEDIPGIRRDLNYPNEIILTSSIFIEGPWLTFKNDVTVSLNRSVPKKMSTFRHTNPWINLKIKRSVRRKQNNRRKKIHQGKKGPRIKGQESTVGASLKTKYDFLQSNSIAKANIFNDQIVSVLTKENMENITTKGPSNIPSMPAK